MEFLSSWDQVVQNLRGRLEARRRAVAVAPCDAGTLEALAAAVQEGLIRPTLVGDRAKIEPALGRWGLNVEPQALVHQPEPAAAARAAVALVRAGQGDFLVKGEIDTRELLKAAVDRDAGLGDGRLMSHAALLEAPKYSKMLLVADGGMIERPTLEQKKGILANSAGLLRTLGYDRPIVAVLAAVEKVNPRMPETVDAQALERLNREGAITGCLVEGPLSLDLALVPRKAALKGYRGQAAGRADVLLVPDLCVGNCLIKALTEMAGAVMAGVVVGARAPMVVTSRGSSAEEKRRSIILAAALARPAALQL
jgi:phosphate butyryltransferase